MIVTRQGSGTCRAPEWRQNFRRWETSCGRWEWNCASAHVESVREPAHQHTSARLLLRHRVRHFPSPQLHRSIWNKCMVYRVVQKNRTKFNAPSFCHRSPYDHAVCTRMLRKDHSLPNDATVSSV